MASLISTAFSTPRYANSLDPPKVPKLEIPATTSLNANNTSVVVTSRGSHNGHISKSDQKMVLMSPSHPPSGFPAPAGHQFPLEYGQNIKENVRQLLRDVIALKDPTLQGWEMVDAIQRLGLDHHFQEEIQTLLSKHYLKLGVLQNHHHDDLYAASLRFRLLRQGGYYVPAADVFDKFTDEEGKFEKHLSSDIKGLMELYEASQVAVRGEAILDEARVFSRRVLEAQMPQLDPVRARAVADTVAHPHHMSLPRFSSKRSLTVPDSTASWTSPLREFAKLDWWAVQSMHQSEMLQISRWWKELGLAKDLSLVRDQPLKWYLWSMVALTDPVLAEERIDLTKPISLIYVLDDIYDLIGTPDELSLFTEAVVRWEFPEHLPKYMKKCLEALYAITNEISNKVYVNHGWNPIGSLRKTWVDLCKAFMVESKWFASKKLPNAEEYLRNAVVSSGAYVVLIHAFFLLGQGLTEENAHLADQGSPPFISSTATILRLLDDLGSAEDEHQEGNDGSYVEYYMRDNPGCTLEGAREHVKRMISDSWKELNQECISPTNPFPAPLVRASLNLARMAPILCTYDDNKCLLLLLEEHVKYD